MITETRIAQRRSAIVNANHIRVALAQARHALATGTLSLPEAIAHPPAVLAGEPVYRVLLFSRGFGRDRLKLLGAAAVIDGVNLMDDLGDLDTRTRRWLIRVLDATPTTLRGYVRERTADRAA